MASVENIAMEIGFDLVGVTTAQPPKDLGHFDTWLAKGMAGEMHYLEKNRERIAAPQNILQKTRSMISVGLNFFRPAIHLNAGIKISRYALGKDYHQVIGKMLRRLSQQLVKAGLIGKSRSIVDAGPLLERAHAQEAGLGFASKSANLLNPRFGPWFFLAELITDQELEPSSTANFPTCGTCRACIDACPTQAIVEAFVVDARKCISYLTIEHRGSIPPALRPAMGNWVFGCDVCSEVCPFGWKAPNAANRWTTHKGVASFDPVNFLQMNPASFAAVFQGSPLKRPKFRGMLRNVLIALGNQKNEKALPLIQQKTQDADAMIREHASWALQQITQKG